MKIKHNSWWLRWAYLGSELFDKPDQGDVISLCPLFWRIVLLSPLKVALLLVFTPLWIILGVGAGICYIWSNYVQDRVSIRTNQLADTVEDYFINPVYEGAKAVSKKFCPRVRVE